MKKQVLTIAAAILVTLGSATFISCGNEENHDTEHQEHVEETAYSCPMECEGEKTYPTEGSCPECGMDLVEVE